MQLTDVDTLIQTLFENQQFKLLFQEEVKNCSSTKQTTFNAIQSVMEDISENIHSLIQFKLQQAIHEDLPTFIPHFHDYRKQIEQLRSEIKTILQNKQQIDASKQKDHQLQTLLRAQRTRKTHSIINKSKSSLETQNFQIVKMRQQLDAVKLALSKTSNNSILQFVSQANLSIHQRMSESFAKLNSQIQELSTRNSETDLDKSTQSILNYNCQPNLSERVSEIQLRLSNFKKQLQSKIQNSLKSVWNVITNMQNTIDLKKKPMAQAFQSPSQKTVKKGNSFASLLGWKS